MTGEKLWTPSKANHHRFTCLNYIIDANEKPWYNVNNKPKRCGRIWSTAGGELIAIDTHNYFIKLLMFSVSESDRMLLYGFCTPTTQPPFAWKRREVTKARQSIWSAILPETETTAFINSLTQPGLVALSDELSFRSPELVERPVVLSNDGKAKEPGPVSEFRQLIEFWNVRKDELFQNIKNDFATDGKELYQCIRGLLSWAHEECGIDFLSKGHRFGNFEFYQFSAYANAFEIVSHRECGLTKTSIRKKCEFQNDLIVNCTSTCWGQTILNQTQLFTAEETVLDFTAKEPMSQVVIQIWDEKSGALIFSKNLALMMGLSIEMNFGSAQYRIRDPWSEKLFSTAANRSDIIKKQIETLSRTTSDRMLTINSSTHSSLDTAMEDGARLFSGYRSPGIGGAFISNRQKDGEIESFLQIRKYIEPTSVKRAIIADPYFSVPAAAKLLTRIPRTDVQIDIITSLGKVDPDTGTEDSVCENYRGLLQKHSATLHGNLCIRNLRRGDKPVFHDRYLIRYFDNGVIDGFLLSNSLNSMGQFYPFVIAPMEREVCLEVCDYLNSMCDADLQNKLPKKERIICDVLFDSKEKAAPPSSPSLSPSLPLSTWLAPWSGTESGISIPERDLPTAVRTIWDHWGDDEAIACQTLCTIASVTSGAGRKLADMINEIQDFAPAFQDAFIPLAKEMERARNHMEKGLESQEYKLWALLNGRAQPSRQGFSLLLEQAGHIWYSGAIWLHSGYDLLLKLDPAAYVTLMEETRSPLMFDILAARMLFYPWADELFHTVIMVGSLYPQIICADWVFVQLKANRLSGEHVEEAYRQLAPEKRILQAARLVSEITFYVRTSPSAKQDSLKWDSLCVWLFELISTDILNCTPETIAQVIYWLYDCEDVSHCKLLLCLSERIEEQSIRHAVLDEAIEIIKHSLLSRPYREDISQPVSMYVQGMDARYRQEAEQKILGKFVDWNVFEIATEPELKNYAYDKWHNAYARAQWQMELLRVYHRQHPEAHKTKQWIDAWEERLGKD